MNKMRPAGNKKKFVIPSSIRSRTPTRTEKDEFSECLEINYSIDYDILRIDQIVKEKLESSIVSSINKLEKEENTLMILINKCEIIIEMRDLDIAKTKVTEKLKDLRIYGPLKRYIT